jgi:hypothetical protein
MKKVWVDSRASSRTTYSPFPLSGSNLLGSNSVHYEPREWQKERQAIRQALRCGRNIQRSVGPHQHAITTIVTARRGCYNSNNNI